MKTIIHNQLALITQLESKFKTIFEQSPFSIQILSKDGKTLLVNPAWKEILGVSEEFIKTYILKEYNALEDPQLEAKGITPLLRKAFAGEVVKLPKFLYEPTGEGRPRWVEATAFPLKDSSGEVQEVVLIHNDMTEQDNLLAELTLERNRIEAVLRQMPGGVLVAEAPHGKITLYNNQMVKFMGNLALPQKLEDYKNHQGLHPDGTPLGIDEWPLIRSLKGEIVRNEEVWYVTPDGQKTLLEVNSRPILDSQGNIAASVVSCTDITERKRKELNRQFLADVTTILLETLDYSAIIEKISTAAIPHLADGCMLDLLENGKINRIVMKHRDPEIEKFMIVLQNKYQPTLNGPQPTSRVMRSGHPELLTKVNQVRTKERTVDEEHFNLIMKIGIHSHIAVPLIIRGQIIGALNFLLSTDRPAFDEEDLNMAKELSNRAAIAIQNARLYRDAQEAIKQREDFISIASHELKTPITSLKLQTEVISRAMPFFVPEGAQDTQFIKKIAASTSRQLDRLNRLVDDMLDLSRISNGKFFMKKKEVEFSKLIKEVLDRFSNQLNESNIPLETPTFEDVHFHCDPYRMEQVITNLMSNAILYGEKRPIELILRKEQNEVFLSIKDQGRGIDPTDHERIFRRFERAVRPMDISGLGLGLFISRQIVQDHGGSISVTSELGKGSTFCVRLPVA